MKTAVPDLLLDGDDEAYTPLTPEEREQLIPSYITLRYELNEAEQINIGAGSTLGRCSQGRHPRWHLSRRTAPEDVCDVWRWAGRYRTTARDIGIDAHRIADEVQQAIGDARYWVEHATYSPDEIAVRFSHRIVAIHPFPNGNGRFSRLVGDLLVGRLGQPPFPWGRQSLLSAGETRARYVAALKTADNHNLAPLLLFARS